MTETRILCDICGKPDASQMQFVVDRQMDGAGSMENVWEYVDLCQEHLALALDSHVKTYRFATELIAWVKERKRNLDKQYARETR
jgi:hypothetical protein